MKKFSISGIIFLVIVILLCGSCKRKDPETVRLGSERYITIINNTGSQLDGYMVNTAGGLEIQKGKTADKSFSIKVENGFRDDLEFEVVLVDVYKRVYAKSFNVAKRGNTDAAISAEDRKTEGFWTDKWRDMIAWLNEKK